MIPRSRKSGYGLLLGYRSEPDGEPLKKTFFDDVRKKNWPKTGKIFTVCFGSLSQSIGRGRLGREVALDVCESRERRDKIVPKFSPEKQEKRKFGLNFSTFLSKIACCSRESTSAKGVTEFPTKKQPKKKKSNLSLSFFFKSGPCASRFQWGIFIFLAADQN